MQLTHPAATSEVDCRGTDAYNRSYSAELFDPVFSVCMFLCMRESLWSTIRHDWDLWLMPMNGVFGGHVPWSDTPNEALQQLLDMEDVNPWHSERVVVLQLVWRLRSLMNMILDGDMTRVPRDDGVTFKWKLWRGIHLQDVAYLVHMTGTKTLDSEPANIDAPQVRPDSNDDIEQFSPNISETDPIECTPRDPTIRRKPMGKSKRKRR